MDAQMKKGILEMCILFSIAREDSYGYTIMQNMHHRFPNVDESTFYSILRRLNKAGCTEIYYGNESNGPKRKYYRITEAGKLELEKMVSDWKEISSVVSEMGIK